MTLDFGIPVMTTVELRVQSQNTVLKTGCLAFLSEVASGVSLRSKEVRGDCSQSFWDELNSAARYWERALTAKSGLSTLTFN